ncbi:MAG: M20 family metallopeptidase [Nocardioides sp.]
MQGATVAPGERRLTVDRARELMDELVGVAGELVACESPSDDLAAVAASATSVAAVGERLLGAAAELRIVDGCSHLVWRLGTARPRILILAHHDTVWPLGSLRELPFAVDETLRGPGSLDMKTGLAMAFLAVRCLVDRTGIRIVVTGDEEIGSPTSRDLIEDEARGCDAVLVLEAGADSGAVKTARKGRAAYELTVAGRAAHAGLEPESGANALVALAELVLDLVALADPGAGTTVTPTRADAGTTGNTVPEAARLVVDVRAANHAELVRVDAAVRALYPRVEGTSVSVSGGIDRPPLQESSSAALFERARGIADQLGIGPLRGEAVGGGSDGNLTAALGLPTLDGLGAVGGGAHARHEHVDLAALPGRLALLTSLLAELTGSSVASLPASLADGTLR